MRIGVLRGRENSFPEAFIAKVNSMGKGVLAEFVQLGGTKLNKFMETVEKVTTAIPEVTVEEADMAYGAPEVPEPLPKQPTRQRGPGRRAPAPHPEEASEPVPATAAASDPWTGLLQAGMSLLQQLAAPATNGRANEAPSLVQRDEKSGETYLRLPVPSPEVLDQVLRGVGALLEGLRRK